MGIKINDNVVYIIDGNDGVSFNTYKNIRYEKLDVQVYYFFQRTDLNNTKNKKEIYNDGNPLLYALKGINNYKIDTDNEQMFFDKIDNAFDSYRCFFEDFDYIILPPTSNSILKRMVDRLNQKLNIPVYEDLFRKKFNKEINVKLIPKSRRKIVENNPNEVFQMKKIKPSKRERINPLKLKSKKINIKKNARILIIDDSITTGTTLKYTVEELKGNGFENCTTFSFFGSKLPNKKNNSR